MKTVDIKRKVGGLFTPFLLLLFGFLFISYSELGAQELTDIDSAEKQVVINKICELIISDYVFPEMAEKCANMLKDKLNRGKYNGINNPRKFAIKVAEDLQAISHDKHFRVQVRFGNTNQSENKYTPEEDFISKVKDNHFLKNGNYGFMNVRWFKGNVGYLDLRAFTAADVASDKAVVAMKFLSDMDAIIIDFRNAVRGGSPEMVTLLCSYFLAKPTCYNTFYNRKDGSTIEEWTLAQVDGHRMGDVPLYILTDKDVFSACEAFTYSLQALKRATVIGEPTKGGAHLTKAVNINNRFIFTIPFARAINPITGTNWEGQGVKPDISVKSDKALDVALKLAGKSADEHRKQREESDLAKAKIIVGRFTDIVGQFSKGEKEKAIIDIRELLLDGYTSKLLTEEMISQVGYDLLSMGLADLALELFKFNVEKNPYSYNSFDSLGEAYLANNDKANAILSYQKALEINPNYGSSLNALKKLGVLK